MSRVGSHGRTVSLDEVPYCTDSCALFERIRDLPGAAFLDSSRPRGHGGRYDILTAAPRGDVPAPPEGPGTETDWRRYFRELGLFHRDHFGEIHPASQDIPFCGGLLGYLGYDCGNALNKVDAASTPATTPYSGTRLQAYNWALIQDHLRQKTVLVAQAGVSRQERTDLLNRMLRHTVRSAEPFALLADFTSNFSTEQYRRAFEKIQAYIHAGDCYQVNLAQRFTAAYRGDPWTAYRELRAVAAAPFSAFLQWEDGSAALCLSPERFISRHGRHVQTAPIKGTRPRYRDPASDRIAAEELQRSEKDRAENLMIVDLLRNDLGRSCVPGTIHVDALFEVQSFPTVHHLVSKISGDLRPDRDAFALLCDSFPGGSITGAPKRRAMEIIAELEPHARELYCGSVLYVSADGRMDSNIAIRTLLCSEGSVRCWGGGGIVADSQWQQEYQETYDKVGQFLSALEGMR